MTGEPVLAVLGAINVDLVVSGAPLPRPGETVTGGTYSEHHGGKGGNQAVAAARASSSGVPTTRDLDVWMLGAVGDDVFGHRSIEALRSDGVHVEHVLVTQQARTGVALIAVDAGGENQISVAAGANGRLEPNAVVGALEMIEPSLLLASLEVPQVVATAALEWCREQNVPTVLNPAPSQPWARALAALATYVTPNERELEALGATPGEVVVIETRGAEGALLHRGDARERVAAPRVDVIDTTGAGDCFNGVLASALALGRDLQDAVRAAVAAASISVTVSGAREGMPDADAIEEALARLPG